MKKISFIVAVSENNVIGKDNELPWHLSDDLKWFKKNTLGCDVIMGKKTYDSLAIRPLPKRKNIVISKSIKQIDGCMVAASVDEAIGLMDNDKENFVIGGGTVFEQFMPFVQKLYLTRVFHKFEGDTFFPEINFNEWKLVFSEKHPKDDKHAFDFEFQIFEKL